jgi:hypothetical protein
MGEYIFIIISFNSYKSKYAKKAFLRDKDVAQPMRTLERHLCPVLCEGLCPHYCSQLQQYMDVLLCFPEQFSKRKHIKPD